MEIEIKIPQSIDSTYDGYSKLLEIFKCFLEPPEKLKLVVMNFRGNTWFEANLLPIVYAFVEYGYEIFQIESGYDNQTGCKLHKLLIRNNFARECFGLPYKPRMRESAVPFKIFKASNTYGFGSYIDSELVRYFPNMENNVKRDLSIFVQELFGNAQIHGNCNKVYT
ncbi:MAG: hypothetical protein K2O02_04675, partial [Lachnospiraceae bacterium]|nr:hypothetical protein [Lachnospiraceae bacterium]